MEIFNKVFVFLLKDTYMQPHLHPVSKKEKCFFLEDHFVYYFLMTMVVVKKILLDHKKKNYFEIPPFTHTYM